MLNYVPLHVHSHFSLMDGVATPLEYVSRAHELGMPGIALSDHGTLTGHREFYREAKTVGVKPIFGIEAYFTPDRTDRRKKEDRTGPLDKIYHHLLLIAKDQQGYRNLNKLNELAWTTGFHYKPRMDYELLEQYHEGIVIGSGCMGGMINQAIEHGEIAKAKEVAAYFKELKGDDFYIEVMPHNIPGMNRQLIELADAMGIPTLVTPDCHHATKDQKVIQEIMLIANTHPKQEKDTDYESASEFSDPMERLDHLYGHDRMLSFNEFDIHLLSGEEMWNAMGEDARPDMFENTLKVYDQIGEYEVPENLDLLPVEYANPRSFIWNKCKANLTEWGLWKQEYIDRLNEELDAFESKGFTRYFVVVGNAIQFCHDNNIMVGPGRGSGAGSLVCFGLGITSLDPIKDGLLFFRFFNPERNDFPDVDIDIEDRRRPEVKAYFAEQYTHVASIATFQEFSGKNIIKDVSRVFCIPLAEVNRVNKQIDGWDDFIISDNPVVVEFRNKYPEVILYGEQLRGRIKGTGVHASGIVASNVPLSDIAPIEMRKISGTKEELHIVAVDMDEAAKIGLIKLDFLGLKALSNLHDTLDAIEKRHGIKIDLNKIPRDDPEVYKMLSNGHTLGVFQCEAAPYTSLLTKIKVRSFEELAATNALVRPGAANTIGKSFIARMHGEEMVEFPCVEMQPVLKETYGCVLYQEQVMLACTTIGGMTMSEADKVRKIIGKKKDAKEFKPFEDKFITHAKEFVGEEMAWKLWHDFEAHSGYSFNKSHAYAYSLVGYWTAWLKLHYPLEFMWAILKNEGDKDTRTQYLIEAKRLGIQIKLPHINESDVNFTIEGDAIRIGLASVKFLSDTSAQRFIDARPFKSYKDVETFVGTKGSGVNVRSLGALNGIGALLFDDNPTTMQKIKSNLYEFLNLPEMSARIPDHWPAHLSTTQDIDETGAYIILGIVTDVAKKPTWGRVTFMDKFGAAAVFCSPDTTIEKGRAYVMLIGGNRVIDFVPFDVTTQFSDSPIVEFLNHEGKLCEDDELFVIDFQSRWTKKRERMATVIVSDSARELDSMVVFPSTYSQAYVRLEPGRARKINWGNLSDGSKVYRGIR